MASLIAKKLSKLPIGTHIEVTYGDGADHHEKVAGVITDSDFSANIEITSTSGEEVVLDFSIVRGVQVIKTLETILKDLPSGAKIRFSYGSEDKKEPDMNGVVVENDNEDNIEIKTVSGEELVLNYSLFRSLLVQTTARNINVHAPKKDTTDNAQTFCAPVAKSVPLHLQEPDDILNASDHKLKEVFARLSIEEKKKLNSVYDSFKYGVKMNDKGKMISAARQARQIIFQEYDGGYDWSCDAVRFCGFLLRRVNIYDHEVYLIGYCLKEAAYACWKEGKYTLAGAYAIAALLEEPEEHVQDLVIILASGIAKADDASGLHIFSKRLPNGFGPYLKQLISGAFSVKGINISDEQDVASSLKLLDTLYSNAAMAEEAEQWLPNEKPQETEAKKEETPQRLKGVISRLNWAEHTGIITDDKGNTYTFRYQDITDKKLAKTIQDCLRSDLGGNIYMVQFYALQNTAQNIQTDVSYVDRARTIAADASREDRFETAFELCKKALETSDIRRALGDLVKHAVALYTSKQQTVYLKEAMSLYEKHITFYPDNAFAVIDVALCYSYLKKYPQMLEYAEKAVSYPGLEAKQKLALMANYLRMMREYYDYSGDKALLARILEKIDNVKKYYDDEISHNNQVRKQYITILVPYRIIAECGMDMLEAAEADFAFIPANHNYRAELETLIDKARQRQARKIAKEAPVPAIPPVPVKETTIAEEVPMPEAEFEEDSHEEDFNETIVPYNDQDGWASLKLTKQEIINYALNITGPDRIPGILAYLRAGSMLNQQIAPVYHMVALAANDPAVAPDYSITSLMNALETSDADFPELNDCCMGAAFLRASFLSGRGYDYSAQGLRNSISISQRIPALSKAYDTLEMFRKEAGRAIDIYADYRNQSVKQLKVDLDATIRHADELYTKFVLNPAREGVKFARLLETKKIVFDRNGYLATMLHHIIEQNQEALEAKKEEFIELYLNGADQFSPKHISEKVVDEIIVDSWDLAGKRMQLKKENATLQGDRRNNLRSNITEVLRTICQWYALSEQSAGLTWRTEQGINAYQTLRPRLMEQLNALSNDCLAEMESCPNPESITGLFLLCTTARELSARLEGSWKFEQEKFLYVDFLRSNHIMLNQDFTPELSSTFCVLPEFNVLARIRQHVEGEKHSFQEQINQIYGMEKVCNNYGTADRIIEYLEVMGEGKPVAVPDNSDDFLSRTEMQINMRYRSFCETYALAVNYGQIIKSDAFCYTLEDTVRYWYAFCKESKNYGFFTNILLQAEEQIHASAQQYEAQLEEQLDALISSNQQYFDTHPDYAEAIRVQISNQNFTVAEDWMARIRIGDFSLDLQKPEALDYLERFWNSFVVIYNRVFDASRPLSVLLGRREVRNKDSKRAQQLIDNWLHNGNRSNSERIRQLLNLLGWQNIQVTQHQFAVEPRGEFYEVCKERNVAGMTATMHPIAAYGTNLDTKPMYVTCLYGIYDCDRLYEKMRALDTIDGSKIILLDYALGQADRRALARKLKKRENGLRNVNLVIDRVLITYLANNYNENLINRILMATAMPFSYCQPYVVESVHTMPPEIFIGRKDELLKIEQPDGVNLIYGGRQLGKSALFKRALSDIEGQKQQRAVLIDIKELDCVAAARKLSTKLIDLKITPDAEVTDDWDVLCRNIERRLRDENEEISYFLLMLDEADAFINDCANCGYRPLVALKDVQQSLPGRFKYVLAGLHNIVKFNRQVALGNNSVITHIPSLKITPFRTPEAQELLTSPLSYLGFSLPSKVTVSQILATCNYFPGLIQLYAKMLIESIRGADYAGYDIKKTPPYVVSDEHLRRVMSDKAFVEQIYEKFEITLKLDQDQGSCYYPLTLLIGWMYNVAPSKSGYTAKDVLSHAKDLSVHPLNDLDEEKIDALLLELQDLNILRSVSNNSYLLASKNFRDLLGSDEEIFEKLMKFVGAAV